MSEANNEHWPDDVPPDRRPYGLVTEVTSIISHCGL